jgi:DNA ligase-1
MEQEHGKYISRSGKDYTTLAHLDSDVQAVTAGIGCPLDGEIYRPGWSLQEIIRAVKKHRVEVTEELQYWVYDMINLEMPFYKRNDLIQLVIKHRVGNIMYVPTLEVTNEDHLKKIHAQFMEQGFEGTIIRNREGMYILKNRSKDLQKYKDFLDTEFKITGGVPAEGTEEGCVVFICKTHEGKEFRVRPRGSFELRRKWMRDINQIIGKDLTVKYLELSEDGIPTGNTVGVAIRDYE